jgi:tetratricopeptide (TPR) repeat protein
MRRHLIALTVAALCGSVSAAPENITDAELALTPPYCQDVQAIRYGDANGPNASPRAKYWVSLMGKTFWAMHHYCWGLISLHRSEAPGLQPVLRKGLLQSAVADYRYVINNSTPDFVLLPEIYTRMGEAYLLLSNPGAAYEAFLRARELKPDYWPAYSRWADVLIRIGQKTEAKQLVESGLRHAPESKALLAQYRQLGGDPRRIVSDKPASPHHAASSVAVQASGVATDGVKE